MADDAAFIWDQPTAQPPRRRRAEAPSRDSIEGRISLREAEHRFGIGVSTLRAWSRRRSIDAVRASGPHGAQWMVTPESVAHYLSRQSPAGPPQSTGLTDDGSSMLVPRDAWDKLMDQLGNLHEAGMQLASARERAAKAETEATFLRERLAEMRAEHDELKEATRSGSKRSEGYSSPVKGWWSTLRDRTRRDNS